MVALLADTFEPLNHRVDHCRAGIFGERELVAVLWRLVRGAGFFVRRHERLTFSRCGGWNSTTGSEAAAEIGFEYPHLSPEFVRC